MAKGGKNNRKNNMKMPATSGAFTSGTKAIQLSEEEQRLLELAKQAYKDAELDLAEFRGLLEEDYSAEYEQKKANIDAELETEKERIKSEYEGQLKKDNEELVNYIIQKG